MFNPKQKRKNPSGGNNSPKPKAVSIIGPDGSDSGVSEDLYARNFSSGSSQSLVQMDNAPHIKKQNLLTTKKNQATTLKRECIELKTISHGHYFSSRVLADEAQMKNYVKSNKDQLLQWIREPVSDKVSSVIKQFNMQQKLLGSTRDPLLGVNLKSSKLKNHLIDLNQTIALRSETQTRKDYYLDVQPSEPVSPKSLVRRITAKKRVTKKPSALGSRRMLTLEVVPAKLLGEPDQSDENVSESLEDNESSYVND